MLVSDHKAEMMEDAWQMLAGFGVSIKHVATHVQSAALICIGRDAEPLFPP